MIRSVHVQVSTITDGKVFSTKLEAPACFSYTKAMVRLSLGLQLLCCSLGLVASEESYSGRRSLFDFGTKIDQHRPDDVSPTSSPTQQTVQQCDVALSLVDVDLCTEDSAFGTADTGCSAEYPACLDADGNPSTEGTQCAAFCFGAEQQATATYSVYVDNTSRIH